MNFSSLTISSWNLSTVLVFTHWRTSIAISKMSLQRSVGGKLRDSNCNVLCGDINDVCFVLSVEYVSIDLVIVY